MQKNAFFYIWAIYSSFWYWYPNPGYHHENPHVLRIPKMSYFLGVGVSKGELLGVKVNRLWKFGSVTKNKRCHKKKTRPQFWFFGLATESAWAPHGGTHTDSVASPKNQNCGRVFFLQHLLILLTDPKFQSLLTLSSNNSPLETPTPKKYDIFGILRTWAFSWWYPGFGYQYQKLE